MSFWRNYYHLVWGTKDRMPLILEDFESRLHNYIISKAREMEVIVLAINGTHDHVHAVVAIPPKISVSELVKHLKGSSAHYVNTSLLPGCHFKWQRGYGCLTIGEKQKSIAETYVRNQKQHHDENSTNSWLEYSAATDEGIDRISGDRKSVREEFTVYNAFEDFPF